MNAAGFLHRRLHLFLLVLSGTMLAFSFPPFPTGVLAAFAFVPFFIAFEDVETYGKGFRSSYLMFLILNLFALWWVGGFVHGRDVYLMAAGVALVLGNPLFLSLPVLGFVFVRKHLGFKRAVYAFPFIWTAFEYFHSITQLAFPWLSLGNTQTYDLAAIQFASFTGVYGISFWLLCINVIAYFLYAKLALNEWKPSSWQAIAVVVSIVVVYLAPKFYGNNVLENSSGWTDGKKVRVGIVQPNIDPFEKWETHRNVQLALLEELTGELVSRNALDLIVWPETAMPFYLLTHENYHIFERMRAGIDSLGVALLTGIPDVIYYREEEDAPRSSKVIGATGQRYDTFNSSMLLQPGSDEIQKYAKIILVPFGERVPYAEVIPFAEHLHWDFGLGGWGVGTDTTVFKLRLQSADEVWFSNLICYESIYPGFVAGFVRKGAQFLTIITNDSWWGNTPGPYQHQQFAILRAIENRRWIVRCANGGISCFIDPFGRILQPTDMFTQTTIAGQIEVLDELTFYSRQGDAFAHAALMGASLFIAAALGQMFLTRTRRQREST